MSLKKILDGHFEGLVPYGLNGNIIGFIASNDFFIKAIKLVNPLDWVLNIDATISNNLVLDFINVGADNNKNVLISHWTNWNDDFFSQAMLARIPVDLPIFSNVLGKGEILNFAIGSEGSGFSPSLHILLTIEVESI